MQSTNFANGHEMLGVEDSSPTTAQLPNEHTQFPPRYMPPSEPDTSFSTEGRESYDFTYGPDAQGSVPTIDHDLAARAAIASQTEIGNPHGLIPTSEQTQGQLAAIRASELPVGASRSIGTIPRTFLECDDDKNFGSSSDPAGRQAGAGVGSSASDHLREHRKSNYAPGYERAAEAVPQRTYRAEGHESVSFPHEQLGVVAENSSSSRRNTPPDLPPRTQGHDYALSSGKAGVGAVRGSANTGRNSSGASLGSKVKGAFAQVHVSGHDFPPGPETSCYPLSHLLCHMRKRLTRDCRALLRLSGATFDRQLTMRWATKHASWKTKRFSVRVIENTRLGSWIRMVVQALFQDRYQ